jgi:hypothetical protein
MEPMGCPEMSVTRYHCTLHNTTKGGGGEDLIYIVAEASSHAYIR